MKDKKSTITDLQKRISDTRHHITLHYEALHHELNLTERLRHSIQQRPWTWLSSALFFGGIAGFFKRQPCPQEHATSLEKNQHLSKTPLFLGKVSSKNTFFQAGRFLLPLLKPLVIAYATRKVAEFSNRFEEKNTP